VLRPTEQMLGDSAVVLMSGSVPADHEPVVELRQLRHFLRVAEELHFGRAATRLFISQPGLSQSIARLERGLNVQLLERCPHGVQLTDAGIELVTHARRLLADTGTAVERVRSVGRGQAGVLRTGVALLAEPLIAPALAALHAHYPGIVLDGSTAVSERLLAQLSEGRLHVAFVHQVPALTALAGVQWEIVRRGRLAVMMDRQHPLAGRESVALHQLSEETFLVNPRELAPSAYQGLKLVCTEFGGFDPKVTESAATSTPTLDPDWRLIRHSSAVALMAEETARAICPPEVAVVPVWPPPQSAIAVAWRHGDQYVLLDRFLRFVRRYRDASGWLAAPARLSSGRKHLLGGRNPATTAKLPRARPRSATSPLPTEVAKVIAAARASAQDQLALYLWLAQLDWSAGAVSSRRWPPASCSSAARSN
jgi:DNA-binding transcriptional LysR family regulator